MYFGKPVDFVVRSLTLVFFLRHLADMGVVPQQDSISRLICPSFSEKSQPLPKVNFLSVIIAIFGWIKMKLGMQVGLSPEHIVLDGHPAPLPQRGYSPQFSAHISVVAEWLHGLSCHLIWR